jgi:hypothetical protein
MVKAKSNLEIPREGADRSRQQEKLWRLVALFVPLLLVGTWHVRNHAWPMDDAANYMATSYQEYLAFKLHGIWRGATGLIDIRGWRPILFPPLAVPFLALSGGNVIAAAMLTLLVAYFGFLSYAFALARRYVSAPYAAAATVAVATLPAFATYALVFFSEMWWLCFSLAWLYHILASDDLRDRRHASLAGLFLSFSLMIRPAETAAITCLPAVYFLARFVRTSSEGRRDRVGAIAAFGFLIASAGLLCASAFTTHFHRPTLLFIGGLLLIGLAYAQWRRRAPPDGAACFCVVVAGCSLFWWAGFMPALYSWVYTTSFGEMAHALDNHQREGLLAIFGRVFAVYGGDQVILLAGLAAAVVFLAGALPKFRGANSDTGRRIRDVGVVGAGMLLPMLALYALTGTTDPRRPIIAMAVVTLLLAILALAPGRFRAARAIVVCGIAAINAAGLIAAQAHLELPAGFVRAFDLYIPPAHWQEDADPQLIARIRDLDISSSRKLAVYTLALFQASARIYEPAALELAAITAGRPASIGYLWDEGEYDAVLHRLSEQGYRFLLLDVYDGPRGWSSSAPYVAFTKRLLNVVEKGVPSPRGLCRVREFVLNGRGQVLFRIAGADDTCSGASQAG